MLAIGITSLWLIHVLDMNNDDVFDYDDAYVDDDDIDYSEHYT